MLLKKFVAFTRESCNTMFEGLWHNEQGNNVFAKLKMLIPSLIGLSCSAYLLHNCIHHGAGRMNIDIENNANKIYQYFSVYTVRIEQLKEYREFANHEYKRLFSHSNTRWLCFISWNFKIVRNVSTPEILLFVARSSTNSY